MESDKAPRLLGELRQLVERWELELGARPVWWRRYKAINGPQKKPETSAARRQAFAKSRDRAKMPKQPPGGGARGRASAAADERRVAGK
jgi:hypothetical protein